jgi:hypothetical protein
MATIVTEKRKIYIREATEMLDRRAGTLRSWQYDGVLPKPLLPHRDERGWRYWTPDQIEGIKKWIKDTDRRPGKALKGVSKNPERVTTHIHRMRRPRKLEEPAKDAA